MLYNILCRTFMFFFFKKLVNKYFSHKKNFFKSSLLTHGQCLKKCVCFESEKFVKVQCYSVKFLVINDSVTEFHSSSYCIWVFLELSIYLQLISTQQPMDGTMLITVFITSI